MYGDSLKQQVEDRLKFYESGETPRKNIEVMKEAMGLAALEAPPPAADTNGTGASAKKKKKDKKRKLDEVDQENGGGAAHGLNGTANGADSTLNETQENGDGEPKKKKKKKKSKAEE